MESNTTIATPATGTRPDISPQNLPSCILHQDADVTLIDIPRSISEAQGTPHLPFQRNIISCPALTHPFPSNEPKSSAAKLNLSTKMAAEHDDLYAGCVETALSVLRNAHLAEWCLPRCTMSTSISTTVGNKRKASEMDGPLHGPISLTSSTSLKIDQEHSATKPTSPEVLPKLLRRLAAASAPDIGQHTLRWCDVDTAKPTELSWNHHLNNPDKAPRILTATSTDDSSVDFLIPPGASLFLADVASSRPFHAAVRNQARSENTSPLFDFILVDPPWPNASVTRALDKSKSGYQTAPTMWDIRQLLFETDLDVLLAPDGLIAVWITNKPTVRELVLGEDGLFDSWGVDLEEEWLWIKITQSGDPVTDLASSWRKPYEVCLLGRKSSSATDRVGVDKIVRRRVMAGVPDLHSRKPCLKQLIEPLMPDRAAYRALEVFARHLVAGWWSWGNEVIKFNDNHCWTG